jgi:hypothetical protein
VYVALPGTESPPEIYFTNGFCTCPNESVTVENGYNFMKGVECLVSL